MMQSTLGSILLTQRGVGLGDKEGGTLQFFGHRGKYGSSFIVSEIGSAVTVSKVGKQ